MPRKSAKIDVRISNFVDVTVSPPMFSTATFTLDTTGGAPPGVVQSGQRLDVSEVSKLVFRFPADFKPVDVMFAQTAGTADEDGRVNLTSRLRQQKASGNWVLIVLDTLNDGGTTAATEAKWKYFIAVKQLSTGKIGIIDPEISNVDQD